METNQQTADATGSTSIASNDEDVKKTTKLQCAISDANCAALPGHDVLFDVLISPNSDTCYFLDLVSSQELQKYTDPLDEAVKKLVEASSSEQFYGETLCAAKANVLSELHKIGAAQSNNPNKVAPLATGEKPDDVEFEEIVSLKQQQYKLAPKKFLQAFEGKPKHFFKLPKSLKESFKESATLEKWEEDKKEKETLDKKLASATMKDIVEYLKGEVSKDWKLEYKSDKTLSSKLIVKGVAPWLAKFISDENFEVVDKWIALVNEHANVSFNQNCKYLKDAITALKKPVFNREKAVLKKNDPNAMKHFFTPQDWDFARRMIMDVWGQEHDFFIELSLQSYDDAKDQSFRDKVIKRVSTEPLPKVQWDASAGAQLMRFSSGASLGAEFTLWKGGSVALSAGASTEIALVEAKAEGTYYIPHNQGHPIKPKVLVKKELFEYKPFGNSKSDGSTHFLSKKESVPFFAVDCCLLSPAGAAAVFDVLKHWKATSPYTTQTRLERDRPHFIQVEGYTSATGSEAHNQKLGSLRAYSVVDFITQSTASWVGNFKCGRWGRDEIDFMVYVNIIFEKKKESKIAWSEIGKSNSKIPLVQQLLTRYPQLQKLRDSLPPETAARHFLEGDIWEVATSGILMAERILAGDSMEEGKKKWKVSRIQGVIEKYFRNLYMYACEKNGIERSSYTKYLKGIRLHENPAVSYGESKLKVNVENEAFQNRRCEFLAYELDPNKTKIKEEETKLYLGDIRCAFEGSIKGWAGANIQLGAQLEISCPEGMLNIVGTNKLEESKKSGSDTSANGKSSKLMPGAKAEAKGAAFAGAKGEVGIKAIIDWRKPTEDELKTQKPVINLDSKGFLPFGSVGYTFTGMLGVGFEGEFKIGFDVGTGTFVIKVQASLAFGPGAGGQLDIAVGTSNLWSFAVFVFEEMQRNHFSRVDIFETETDESGINVFEIFCSWGWKLLALGAPGAAAVTLMGAYSDELLSNTVELLNWWKERKINIEHLKNTINCIDSNPELIKIMLPETKARILYELLMVSASMEELISNIGAFDFNHKREEATKKLIKHGIHTLKDWHETLEHIGQFNGKTFEPLITPGASQEDKVKRRNENLQFLRSELLNDTDDWAEIEKHIGELPE